MLLPRRMPSGAELDRRLAASRALAVAADRHIDRARQLREENNMAAIITDALGIRAPHGNGGNGHAGN